MLKPKSRPRIEKQKVSFYIRPETKVRLMTLKLELRKKGHPAEKSWIVDQLISRGSVAALAEIPRPEKK